MNDVMRYEIDYGNRAEHEADLDREKSAIIERLTRGRASALELHSLTKSGDHFIVQEALDRLQSDGTIRYIQDGSISSSNNVVVFYELVRGIEDIAVSAHPVISTTYGRLHELAYESGDINKANSTEWCLLSILEKADYCLRSGNLELDMESIRDKMVSDLADEGEEKWKFAFDSAASRAHELFQPHVDSV